MHLSNDHVLGPLIHCEDEYGQHQGTQPNGAAAQDARCAAGALDSLCGAPHGGFRGMYGGRGFSMIRGGGQGSPRVV